MENLERKRIIIEAQEKKIREKTYVGQTALGAKAEVHQLIENKYNLLVMNTDDTLQKLNIKVTNSSLRGWEEKIDLMEDGILELTLKPMEAESLDNNFGILLVCRLTLERTIVPLTIEGGGYAGATLDSPTELHYYSKTIPVDLLELWIFNSKTGQIYKKIKIHTDMDQPNM